MIVQRGHATAQEQAAIESLEREYTHNWPVERILDLAQLYIDPFHEEDRAIPLLKAVLASHPNNARATYWLAHCMIHYELTDEAMREAVSLVRPLAAADAPWPAAAKALEAGVLEWLVPDDLAARIALLEAAARLAPDWVTTRSALAADYKLTGQTGRARGELERALENLSKRQEVRGLADEYFHVNVTGLLGDPDELRAQLELLGG